MNNQLLQMIFKSGNPQQAALNILTQYSQNSPMMRNVLSMYNSGNAQGMENLVKNICAEKNINVDEIIQQINKLTYSR